ncbi:cupin domain-containing protein [Verrucomicrobiota bacterium]
MNTRSLSEIERTKVEMDGAKGAWKQLAISGADGSPGFSMRVFTVEPGGHTPFHQHDCEHLNYIIEGRGELLEADGGTHPLRRGDFALVLPGEKHQYRNTAEDQDLVMICAVPKAYE